MENIGTFKVLVCRHGKLSNTVKVRVETIDGSAVEGEDYQVNTGFGLVDLIELISDWLTGCQ